MPNQSILPACATGLAAALIALSSASTNLLAQAAPAELVQRAATAMGGADALRALANITIEFNSAAFGLGQEETPSSPARATFNFGRVVTDYRGGRRLTTQESRAVTGAVQRQRTVVTPTAAAAEVNGVMNSTGAGAMAAVAADIRAQPERLVLSALDNPGQLTAVAPQRIRGELMDGVRLNSEAGTPTLWFD